MLKKALCTSLLLAVTCGSVALAGGGAHWGYGGPEGPEHWGDQDPAYWACAKGKNQSPIDVRETVKGRLPRLRLTYARAGHEIHNNGHTVWVKYKPGSTMNVGGHVFTLLQFHFHAPSENTIRGRSYPMEAHFVHADEDRNLAVVAVMFQEGERNEELEKAWAHMPAKEGEMMVLPSAVDAARLLPQKRDYYRFNGSLTTPPCSEGVWWLVMKDPVNASRAQIQAFRRTMGHANNRPVQPLNARVVVE